MYFFFYQLTLNKHTNVQGELVVEWRPWNDHIYTL